MTMAVLRAALIPAMMLLNRPGEAPEAERELLSSGHENGRNLSAEEHDDSGGLGVPWSRDMDRHRGSDARGKKKRFVPVPVRPVGGQAVMEGILMRNGGRYAVAVRRKDGKIFVERHGWFGLTRKGPLSPSLFARVPLLVETLVNGVRALNRSAELSGEEDGEESPSRWQIFLSVVAAFGLAALMFVVIPHMLSLGMQAIGMGGDMEGFSFHMWDGLFKFAMFIGYIAAISCIPEIRRVFQYHGAEHKVIAALESGEPVSARSAKRHSRTQPSSCPLRYHVHAVCAGACHSGTCCCRTAAPVGMETGKSAFAPCGSAAV